MSLGVLSFNPERYIQLKPHQMAMTGFHGLDYLSFEENLPFSEQCKLLEEALINHPEDELVIIRHLLPINHICKNPPERTLELADKLILLSNDDYDVETSLFHRALVLFEHHKNYDEAEALFFKVLEIEPEHSGVFDRLIDLYREKDELEKALQIAARMSKFKRLKYYGLMQRGQILLEIGRLDESVSDFQMVVADGTYALHAHEGLGKCYLMMRNYQAAMEQFLKAHEICHYPETLYPYGVGLCYQHLNDPYRAMKWYTIALAINPLMPEALNNMAALHHELNNGWEEAVPFLLNAAKLSNEAINRKMQPVYRNLWAYYTNILDHDKAEYYKRLNMKCTGLDDDAIDFFESFD